CQNHVLTLPTRSPPASLDASSSRWFEPRAYTPSPRGHPSSRVQHTSDRALHSVPPLKSSWHTGGERKTKTGRQRKGRRRNKKRCPALRFIGQVRWRGATVARTRRDFGVMAPHALAVAIPFRSLRSFPLPGRFSVFLRGTSVGIRCARCSALAFHRSIVSP